MIGGILAWDGQLMDTGRYTWDLDYELSSSSEDMASKVSAIPSMTLEERRLLAVQFVESTQHSNFDWVNDRACPYTGDSVVTPVGELAMEVLATGPQAAAIGSVSPPFSKMFHDYVDAILIEGGWKNGALNGIHDRIDPCAQAGFINRSNWDKNFYYEDIQAWRANITTTSTSNTTDDKPTAYATGGADESGPGNKDKTTMSSASATSFYGFAFVWLLAVLFADVSL